MLLLPYKAAKAIHSLDERWHLAKVFHSSVTPTQLILCGALIDAPKVDSLPGTPLPPHLPYQPLLPGGPPLPLLRDGRDLLLSSSPLSQGHQLTTGRVASPFSPAATLMNHTPVLLSLHHQGSHLLLPAPLHLTTKLFPLLTAYWPSVLICLPSLTSSYQHHLYSPARTDPRLPS
jgi:hypothetical protein